MLNQKRKNVESSREAIFLDDLIIIADSRQVSLTPSFKKGVAGTWTAEVHN